MTSVLVLGGTLFLGRHLVWSLLEQGVEVTVATRGQTADPFGDRVKRLVVDREKKESIAEAVKGLEFEAVYDQLCYSPQEAQDLVDLFNGRIGKYVFTSTMAVYEYGLNRRETDFCPQEYPVVLKGRREYTGLAGYQEAKRAAEAVLFQQGEFAVSAVRFPLVIGRDDYTKRLQVLVESAAKGHPVGVANPEARFGFISSQEAGRFLAWLLERDLRGPINAAAEGDASHRDLFAKVLHVAGREAQGGLFAQDPAVDPSPYSFAESWSLNTERAREAGYAFERLEPLLDDLIAFYLQEAAV